MLLANTPRALLLTVGAIFSASVFAQATDSTQPAAQVTVAAAQAATEQSAEPTPRS